MLAVYIWRYETEEKKNTSSSKNFTSSTTINKLSTEAFNSASSLVFSAFKKVTSSSDDVVVVVEVEGEDFEIEEGEGASPLAGFLKGEEEGEGVVPPPNLEFTTILLTDMT